MSRACDSVSVVITTRDRADQLDRCLTALTRQEPRPPASVEVVVVDNGSTDPTPEVVARHAEAFPWTLRRVEEPVAGRARALNTGLLATEADLVFLLDDDARPDPDWLVETWRGFAETDADLVGGRLRPPPGIELPDWYRPESMSGILAQIEWGDEPFELTDEYPYGANLAFRRDTARALGGFDLRLGRTARSLLAGEDHDFCRRVLLCGGKGMYWPASRCEHDVRPERLRREYFKRWKFMAGRSGYHLMYPGSVREILGAPRFVVGQLLRAGVHWLAAWARGDRDDAFSHSLAARAAAGCLYEAVRGRHAIADRPQLLDRPRPTVGVVIPARDAADTIGDAIASARDGTWTPDEIVVVDDGSTDGTAEIAVAAGDRVRVVAGGGRGPSAARNLGIQEIRSEWVAFLDADDLWTPDRLQAQFDAIAPYPEVCFVSSRVVLFDESGREWPGDSRFPPAGVPGMYLETALRDNYIGTLTVLARRSSLLACGGFDETKDRSEDFDLWSKVVARYPSLFVDRVGARRRIHPGGLSRDTEGIFASHDDVVRARLAEQEWSPARKASVQREHDQWIRFHRGHTRLADGEIEGARTDLAAFLAREPWNLRAGWLLALTLLPGRSRRLARRVVRGLRGGGT